MCTRVEQTSTATLPFGRLVPVLILSLPIPWPTGSEAYACNGCFRLPRRSLLEKVEQSDRVVVAQAVAANGKAWRIVRVLKGGKVTSSDLSVNATGQASAGFNSQNQLLGWTDVLNSWQPLGLADAELVEFLAGAISSSAVDSVRDQAERLRYFVPYLEHTNERIADSAHTKLANAPYTVLRHVAVHLDSKRLRTWILAQRTAIKERASLYITLLGFFKDAQTVALIQKWVDQRWKSNDPRLLAALLTAYINHHGEQGVRFVESTYIQDRDRTLGEIIAAVDALRTHGDAQTRIRRDRIKVAFHRLINDRPPLAELIIDDFVRWRDWSIAPQLIQLHDDGQQPWNNALIMKYLAACPRPDARAYVTRVSPPAESDSP